MLILRTIHCVTAVMVTAGGLIAQASGVGSSAGASIAGPGLSPPRARITAPFLGYFFDRERQQLQSIVGILGSGFPGAAIEAGSGAVAIEISPSQDYALAILPGSGQLSRISLDGDIPVAAPVAGAMAGITRISISPTGRTCLFYSAATQRVQVFTGFPEAPALAHEFDWSALGGLVTAIGVSDAGDFALVAAQSDTTALFAVSVASGPAMIYRTQAISSVAFFRNSREALVAAPLDNQVIWVRDNGGVPNPVILADEHAGISAPQAVAASEDGRRAFVLDRAAGILAIPLSGAAPTRATCACRPSQLQRMRGHDVFLLTASLQSPLAVLDASSEAIDLVMVRVEPPQSAVVPAEVK